MLAACIQSPQRLTMGHANRAQVRLPRRLVDELVAGLNGCVQRLDKGVAGEEGKQLADHCRRIAKEARERLEEIDRERAERQQAPNG